MDVLNITKPQGSVFTGSQNPVAVPVPQSQAFTPEVKTKAPSTADKARYEEVVKAASAVQGNYYVVSETRFTIFKDIAGDYVTRFTSLKDGSVKYYPQKSLFELAQVRNSALTAVFDTQA